MSNGALTAGPLGSPYAGPRLSFCVGACACECARMCVCVCACVCKRERERVRKYLICVGWPSRLYLEAIALPQIINNIWGHISKCSGDHRERVLHLLT
jgi:hypothetical protein